MKKIYDGIEGGVIKMQNLMSSSVGDCNEEGSENDQSKKESKEDVTVKEKGWKFNLPSNESPEDNSQTFKESSLKGRNKKVPFWMEDYMNRGNSKKKLSLIWSCLPQLQIQLYFKKLFRVSNGELQWTWR